MKTCLYFYEACLHISVVSPPLSFQGWKGCRHVYSWFLLTGMSFVLVCHNDFFAGSHISFGTFRPLNLQIYFILLHDQLYVPHTLCCKLFMTMIIAYLHHLGYVLPPGALDISNGLLESEVNHKHLKLLDALSLPTSLYSKNTEKIHHINYILLFNAQKDDIHLFGNMPQGGHICHYIYALQTFYSWSQLKVDVYLFCCMTAWEINSNYEC